MGTCAWLSLKCGNKRESFLKNYKIVPGYLIFLQTEVGTKYLKRQTTKKRFRDMEEKEHASIRVLKGDREMGEIRGIMVINVEA